MTGVQTCSLPIWNMRFCSGLEKVMVKFVVREEFKGNASDTGRGLFHKLCSCLFKAEVYFVWVWWLSALRRVMLYNTSKLVTSDRKFALVRIHISICVCACHPVSNSVSKSNPKLCILMTRANPQHCFKST